MTAVLQQLKPAFRIQSVATTNNGVQIVWKDGHESFYHNLWLLDSCRSPKFFHRDTLSLSSGHDLLQMPLNPTPEGEMFLEPCSNPPYMRQLLTSDF